MGHDHGNDDHGTGDPGTEFPIHPMRASGQCPETIPGLGKCLKWLGFWFYTFLEFS